MSGLFSDLTDFPGEVRATPSPDRPGPSGAAVGDSPESLPWPLAVAEPPAAPEPAAAPPEPPAPPPVPRKIAAAARKKTARKAPARKVASKQEEPDEPTEKEAAAAARAAEKEAARVERIRGILAMAASGVTNMVVAGHFGTSPSEVSKVIGMYRLNGEYMPDEPEDLPLPDMGTTEYARKVVAGEIVMGLHVRNACARHLRDLERTDIYFDEDKANDVFRFLQRMRATEGQFAGHRLRLLGWQVFVVGSIFGWLRRSDGMRRFRKAWIEGGKGMGKTPILGGVAHWGLLCDGEPGAQIYFAASTEDQAKIAFGDMRRYIDGWPWLWARLEAKGDKIAVIGETGYAVPLPWKHGGIGLAGKRPYYCIIDEAHEHRSGAVMDSLELGLKFRRQGLIVSITNSGERQAGWAYEEHLVACAIAAGTREDDSYFSFVCGLDEEDGPITEAPRESWMKANPGLERDLPGYEFIASQILRAKNNPSARPQIERFFGCRWGATDRRQWIAADVWRGTVEGELPSSASLAGKDCFLAFARDGDDGVAALAFAWRTVADDGKTDRVDLDVTIFVPEDLMSEPLWETVDVSQPGVVVVEGRRMAGYGSMRDCLGEAIREALRQQEVGGIAVDRASRPYLETVLAANGVELADDANPWGGDLYCREMRRHYAPSKRKPDGPIGMPSAMTATTALIAEGRLRARANDVVAVMLDALRLREDEERGLSPDSEETGRNIAPLFAVFAAVAWAAQDE